jgi:tight adherence protein B
MDDGDPRGVSVKTVLLFVSLVLLGTLLVAILVLRLDSRRKRLEQRVEMCADVGGERDQRTEGPRSIRTSRASRARLPEILYSVLRLPVGLPHANVVPIWLVFATSIMIAAAMGWGANFIIPATWCWLGGLAASVVLARGIFGWEVERYRAKLLQQMPDAIELVVSAVRAGLPVSESFRGLAREMPSPTREEFAQMISEMSLGAPPEEALMSAHRRTRVTEYAMFAVTVAVQMRSGGRLAETIQNLAETVRQRVAIAQRANALAAEAKLSARVISILPFIGGALMAFLQPGSMGPLLHEPRGKQMLAFGSVSLVLGMFTMAKMIRGVTRE